MCEICHLATLLDVKFDNDVHFTKIYFLTQFMTSLGDRVKGRQIHNSTKEWTKYVKFVTWTHFWTTNSMLMFIFQKNNVYDSIHDVIGGQGKKGIHNSTTEWTKYVKRVTWTHL